MQLASQRFYAVSLLMELSTFEARIVDKRGESAVGIDRQVEVLVDQEVVARTLADNFEIIDEGGLKGNGLRVGLKFRYARRLVFHASQLPDAPDSLRLEVGHHVKAARSVKRQSGENM